MTSPHNPEFPPDGQAPAHPRALGWIGTTALAMGGSNQSLFILAALFAGQGEILGQGSAAVPLLMVAGPLWITKLTGKFEVLVPVTLKGAPPSVLLLSAPNVIV